MAINKKLIHFDKFDNFNSLKLSANKENTMYTNGLEGSQVAGSPDILYQSIVFIKDTKQVWTHGSIYYSSAEGIEDLLKSKVSSSSTSQDHQIPVFDGTTGKIIKTPDENSMAEIISDLGVAKDLHVQGSINTASDINANGNGEFGGSIIANLGEFSTVQVALKLYTEDVECIGSATINGDFAVKGHTVLESVDMFNDVFIDGNLDVDGDSSLSKIFVDGIEVNVELYCYGDAKFAYCPDPTDDSDTIANTTFVLKAINHKLTGIQESIDEIEEKIDNNIKVYVINLVGGVVLNSSSDLSSMYDDISADVEHSLIRISSKASSSATSPLMYDCGNISYYEPAINAGAINISVTGQITSYNVMLLRGSCTVTTKTWTLS